MSKQQVSDHAVNSMGQSAQYLQEHGKELCIAHMLVLDLATARHDLAASQQRCRELEAQVQQLAMENGQLGYAVKSPELYQCLHESLAAQRQKEGK